MYNFCAYTCILVVSYPDPPSRSQTPFIGGGSGNEKSILGPTIKHAVVPVFHDCHYHKLTFNVAMHNLQLVVKKVDCVKELVGVVVDLLQSKGATLEKVALKTC